jgi:hypothetical protein
VKVLLDNCVTHDLRPMLSGHDVVTAKCMGWDQLTNGALLAAAAAAGFHAMVTVDRNIQYQQAPPLPVAVIFVVAPTNRIEDIAPLVPRVLLALASLVPNTLVEIRS